MVILEVNNISKRLGKRPILKNISFQVEEGEIYGFLGPNGVGKTTTIKMLVGLIKPDAGSIKIAGKDIQTEREEALKNIGAVVENPELYTYMTGIENLRQLARINKSITAKDIDEVVNLVGLSGRINEKVKKYSLGMKQRLGLAQALLSKPKILILDEPTNGLDPTGIIEFRNILKKLSLENKISVFVSSHMLSEVQQLCTRVAFVNNGEIKAIESISSLVSGDSKEDATETIIISTTVEDKCMEVLKGLPYVHNINKENELIVISADKGSASQMIFALAKSEIPLEEVYKRHQDLESRYLQIIKSNKASAQANSIGGK